MSAATEALIVTIPSPPLPIPSPPTHTNPTYDEAPLGYRAAGIRDDIPEAGMPLRKRARFTALAYEFEIRERSTVAAARQPGLDVAIVDATPVRPMSREVSYGIEDVWDDMVGDMEERVSHPQIGSHPI
ncbi:hypothetical protein Tco_0184309 [Tanacetum coccineum]